MTLTLTAIYENGVLRLPHPLPLPENTPVEIQVHALPQASADLASRVAFALRESGLARAPQPTTGYVRHEPPTTPEPTASALLVQDRHSEP